MMIKGETSWVEDILCSSQSITIFIINCTVTKHVTKSLNEVISSLNMIKWGRELVIKGEH